MIENVEAKIENVYKRTWEYFPAYLKTSFIAHFWLKCLLIKRTMSVFVN